MVSPRPRELFVRSTPDDVVVMHDEDLDVASSAASSLTNSTSSKSSSRKKYTKPPATRMILEAKPMKNLLSKYLKNACPACGSELLISFPTTCIATSICLDCSNEVRCKYVDLVAPATSNIPLADDASEKIKRNTDSAINILYVLSFISSGDGGAEASRVLGLLGFPNCTTMQGRSFTNIEHEISPVIQQYTEDIILDNIREEVKLVYGDRVDATSNRRLYDLWVEDKLPVEQWPRIDGCADMGWQQKGSGRQRNSKSGHALIFAMLTRKAVAMTQCSKACGFCKTWFTRHTIDEEVPPHNCLINHEETSGSMEPVAVLRLYIWLYNQRVIVARFRAESSSARFNQLR